MHCMVAPQILLELPKNKRMLQLQDIAPQDKLPKAYASHIGGAPLHYYSSLAICHLGFAALKKVYWEGSQKNRMLSPYDRILHT